jgi:excisionase family DNA binding protein
MTNNGFHNGLPPPGHGPSGEETQWIPETVRHLALVLSGHVRRLNQEALPVPHEVEELAIFLVRLARTRQDPPTLADALGTAHYALMPDRLLVAKGEAAGRLDVSVRTFERLVATGRLPQVHVERLARFRVSDLEAYVNSLPECHASDLDSGNPMVGTDAARWAVGIRSDCGRTDAPATG